MNRTTTISWHRMAFSLVVLIFLGLLGFINLLLFLPDWMGWIPYNAADKISAMGHFQFVDTGDTQNLIHELVFALIIGTSAVGLLSQLRKSMENIAGQLIALISWFALILTAVLTNNWVPQPLFLMFGGLTLLATILHPSGRGLFNWFSFSRVNRVLLALVVVAAVPLLPFAVVNIGLQSGGTSYGFAGLFSHQRPAIHGGSAPSIQEPSQDQPSHNEGDAAMSNEQKEHDHAATGHYRNWAALSFIILGVGLLASLRPKGWRFAAWVTGALPALIGLFSLVFLDDSASLGLFWGLVAIVWGVIFIAAAEFTRNPPKSRAILT